MPLKILFILQWRLPAGSAVADSNHDQEWGLIKSGKGEEKNRRRGGTTICNRWVHIFLCGTKGRNYETGVGRQSLCCPSRFCVAEEALGVPQNCDKRCLSEQESLLEQVSLRSGLSYRRSHQHSLSGREEVNRSKTAAAEAIT